MSSAIRPGGIVALSAMLLMPGAIWAQSAIVQLVPDVEAQFDALPERAEALGFGIGGSPDPEVCKHYQGIVRSTGPGTPYLFVSRSGNETGAPGCSSGNQPGNLLIVKMGSRPTHGERLRSNRLRRGTETRSSAAPSAASSV